MGSIHKRIRELRKKKGLSQEALANLVGVSYQSVQEWEREPNDTAPRRNRHKAVADALGVSVHELLTGEPAARGTTQTPLEEILLELFRGLTREQQREAVRRMRAMVDANREIQERFLNRPLRTFSNEEVEAAFGKIPALKPARKKTAKPKRDPGTAMDDYLEE